MPKNFKKAAEKAPEALRILWREGFFKDWNSQDKVVAHLGKRGNNFPPHTLDMALRRAAHLVPRKKDGVLEYIQRKPAVSKEIDKVENELFDAALIKKFGKPFEIEIADLQHNFNKSGNCTAFLLRKILEKLIYITFAKNGFGKKLEDSSGSGRLIGLEGMINAAVQRKIKGVPFLTTHTAQEIRGIKFLGDASAHNPLVEVDMKTILPQIPFIITAYKELLR